jgi:L-threonylcarbamoyladenylate synthase
MKTERLTADKDGVLRAAELLAKGQLVAFPTETVYGLGACVDNETAVASVYRAKGRPAEKALLVHVASKEQARGFVSDWPLRADRLCKAFWPGPLTLILPRSENVPDIVVAGGTTVGLRAPAHPVALALLHRLGRAIAAPSANLSGLPPPTNADAVLRQLDGRIAAVLDAGETSVQSPSTILDLSRTPAAILRQGSLERDRLTRFVAILP